MAAMNGSGITFAIIIFPIILTVSSMMFQLKPPLSSGTSDVSVVQSFIQFGDVPCVFFVLKTLKSLKMGKFISHGDF